MSMASHGSEEQDHTEETDRGAVEPRDEALDAFFDKIYQKCQKYRDATAKDKAKQTTLRSGLSKDFGANINIDNYMNDTRREAEDSFIAK